MASCPVKQDGMRPRRRGSAEGTGSEAETAVPGALGAGLGGEPVPQGQTQWTGVCVVTPWRDGASGQDADALRLGEPLV